MTSSVEAQLARLLACAHPDPHALLGAHPAPDGITVRALKPGASAVAVRTADSVFELDELVGIGAGLFSAIVPVPAGTDYRLLVTYPPGRTFVVPDGYLMPPTVSVSFLESFAAGRHRRLWEALGARPTMMNTPSGAVSGTAFAVWAPHACAVSVIGDFDGWTGPGAPMRRLGPSGVWEVFVPGVAPGDMYKFRIRQPDGSLVDRADPLARAAEPPPKTASRVAAAAHRWRDADWMRARARADPRREPMSIYEVHVGSWLPGLDYAQLADRLVPYVAGLGFTHVEFLPVCEHPYGGSWGYQVTSYFAPTARFGDSDGLRALVDRFHAAGIGVIADWVPAHFPRDGWALARFDGVPLYEPSDPLRADHPDWGTLTFDLERPQVRSFLMSSALYWIEQFHLDGLRVDAVASLLHRDYSRGPGRWRPHPRGGRIDITAVEFLRELTAAVAEQHPGATLIAEDSSLRRGTTAEPASGGLGFTFRWNLGWLHDTLGFLELDEHGRAAAPGPAATLDYAWDADHVLAISHDEVVHGKGTPWARARAHDDRNDGGDGADFAAMLALMWAFPGKKLLFMGQEFGQETEWSDVFGPDWGQLDRPAHAAVQALTARLNALYRATPSLWRSDCSPDALVRVSRGEGPDAPTVAFARTADNAEPVVCIANFTGTPAALELAFPPNHTQLQSRRWRIMLDTKARLPHTRPPGQHPVKGHEDHPVTGHADAATVTVAAHSTVWLTPETTQRATPECGGGAPC